jgi:hypothetical protein
MVCLRNIRVDTLHKGDTDDDDDDNNNNNNNNNNVLSPSLHYNCQVRQTDSYDAQVITSLLLSSLRPSGSSRFAHVTVRADSGFPLAIRTRIPGHGLYHHHVDLLRQIHSLHKSKFSSVCHLVLPPSVHSIFSFPWGHPVPTYVFFVFPSCQSLLQ